MKHSNKTIRCVMYLVISALFTAFAVALPGDLDTTFNGSGKVRIGFGYGIDEARAVAVQADGKLIVAGFSSSDGTRNDFAVVRLNQNGTIDTSFGDGGRAITPIRTNGDDKAYAAAIQADGKIVLAGDSTVGTNTVVALARYNTDGTLDTGFDTDGKLTTSISVQDTARTIAIQSDQKILVGGDAFQSGYNFALIRYTTNGSLDTTFDGDGKVTTNVGTGTLADGVSSVAIQTDGKIVAAGYAELSLGAIDFAVARYQTNGTLDPLFDSDGIATLDFTNSSDFGAAVAIQADSKIVVAGTTVPGTTDIAIARFNSDGSPDNTFDIDGKTTTAGTGEGNAVSLQGDGRIVVTGTAQVGCCRDLLFVRYNTDGSLDTGFDGDGIKTVAASAGEDRLFSVAIQTDGRIVSGGFASGVTRDFVTVRLNSDGSFDNSLFGTNGIAATDVGNGNHSLNDVVRQSDGKLVLVGSVRIGALDSIVLTRLNPGGTVDTSFGINGTVITSLGSNPARGKAGAIQTDGKILVAGSSSTDFAVLRYLPDGSLDTSFNGTGIVTTAIGALSDARDVLIQPDGKILVGGGALVSGFDTGIARYNTDGSLDTSFDGDGILTASIGTTNDDFGAMARQPDGKIVSVGSTGSSTDFLVFRFNPDGSLDTSFDFDGVAVTPIGTGSDGATAVAIQGDGRIVVAGYAFVGPFEDFAVARYNPDGSLDAAFDTDGKVVTPVGSSSDRATGVLIQTDSRIVVTGTVLNNSNNNDFAAVRYNSNGGLDNSLFGTGGKAIVDLSGADDSAISSLLDNFGRVVIVGTSGGKYGALRLLGDLAPTASNVAVSGRILTADGSGLRNAVVTLTDANGASRGAISSTFGYYRFDGVRAGEIYVITVASKRHSYAPRVLSVGDDLTNVDFVPVSGDDAER